MIISNDASSLKPHNIFFSLEENGCLYEKYKVGRWIFELLFGPLFCKYYKEILDSSKKRFLVLHFRNDSL
jgi:hypothetical protein